MRQLTTLEQQFLTHLESPAPTPPLFELWQCTTRGLIVGFFFSSVHYAAESGSTVGWHYVIEDEGEVVIVPESEVEVIRH